MDKKFTSIDLDDGSSIIPYGYAKLQKQIRKLQEENAILKNMAIFAEK